MNKPVSLEQVQGEMKRITLQIEESREPLRILKERILAARSEGNREALAIHTAELDRVYATRVKLKEDLYFLLAVEREFQSQEPTAQQA